MSLIQSLDVAQIKELRDEALDLLTEASFPLGLPFRVESHQLRDDLPVTSAVYRVMSHYESVQNDSNVPYFSSLKA
jgi:hypothetical protein